MDIRKELIDFRKKSDKSWETIDRENITLLIMFLNVGVYQKLPENYPIQKYLDVEISFDICRNPQMMVYQNPKMMLSNFMTLNGSRLVPFTKDFVLDVAHNIQNLHDNEDYTGIMVNISDDKTKFEFWLDIL